MSELSVKEIIENLIHAVAEDLNYAIYESSIFLKGEKTKLTVKIDNQKGISHGDCEIFSRELNRRLEKEEILQNYSLEVSSPGLSRKLRSLDEFERFIGAPVKILCEENGKTTIFKGTIKNVIDTIIELKSDKEDLKVEFNKIKRANLEY